MYLNITIDTYVVASTREVSTAWSKSSLHFAFPRAHLAEARIAVANAKGEPEVAPLFRVASRHIDDTLSQSLDVGHLTGLILDVDRRIEHPDREVWLSDGIDELDVLRCELRGLANPGANRQLGQESGHTHRQGDLVLRSGAQGSQLVETRVGDTAACAPRTSAEQCAGAMRIHRRSESSTDSLSARSCARRQLLRATLISRLVNQFPALMCQLNAPRMSPAASRCPAITAAISSAAAALGSSRAAARRRCSCARAVLSCDS